MRRPRSSLPTDRFFLVCTFQVLGSLGAAAAMQGRHADAVALYDRALLAADGGDGDALRFNRANSLADAGDLAGASLTELDAL